MILKKNSEKYNKALCENYLKINIRLWFWYTIRIHFLVLLLCICKHKYICKMTYVDHQTA